MKNKLYDIFILVIYYGVFLVFYRCIDIRNKFEQLFNKIQQTPTKETKLK